MNQEYLKHLSLRDPGNRALDHWIALIYLGLLIVCEVKTTEVVSPLMSMLAFGFFAQRMRPPTVALWTAVYTIISFYFLLQPEGQLPLQGDDRMTAYIRCGTLGLAAIGALMLSLNRVRVAQSFLQTLTILDKLPAPVILSDCSGCIVFMNEDALALLQTTSEEALGSSYFTFLIEGERGKSIQKYLDMVDSKQHEPTDVVVRLKKPERREIAATIVPVQSENMKLLATVLRPSGAPAGCP